MFFRKIMKVTTLSDKEVVFLGTAFKVKAIMIYIHINITILLLCKTLVIYLNDNKC